MLIGEDAKRTNKLGGCVRRNPSSRFQLRASARRSALALEPWSCASAVAQCVQDLCWLNANVPRRAQELVIATLACDTMLLILVLVVLVLVYRSTDADGSWYMYTSSTAVHCRCTAVPLAGTTIRYVLVRTIL